MNNINGVLKKKDDTYSILASTKDMDRDGEIILPTAFKNLDRYLKENPVILGFHNYNNFPIGKAVDGKIDKNALVLDIVFAETDSGKEAKYLFDNGFMNSFSVGFIPKEWDYDGNGARVYSDVELLEVSAVPVPANAAANIIRAAEKDGIELKHFKSLIDESSNDTANAESHEPDDLTNDLKNIKLEKDRIQWTK